MHVIIIFLGFGVFFGLLTLGPATHYAIFGPLVSQSDHWFRSRSLFISPSSSEDGDVFHLKIILCVAAWKVQRP